MRSMVLILFFLSEVAVARTIDCHFYETWKDEPFASFSKPVDLSELTPGFSFRDFKEVSAVKENGLIVAGFVQRSLCLDGKKTGCLRLHISHCDEKMICSDMETIFKNTEAANLTLVYSSHGSVKKKDFKLVCRTDP